MKLKMQLRILQRDQKKWKYKERLGDMENRYVLPSSNMTFTEVGTRERWDIFKVKMDKSLVNNERHDTSNVGRIKSTASQTVIKNSTCRHTMLKL